MLYPTNHYSTLLSNMVPLSGFVLSPHTAIEWVTLSVSSLEDSIKFYKDVLGLWHLFDTGDKAVLGTRSGTPLVVLVRKPGALPKPDNRRGLYHFALLMPSRKDLARMMVRLAKLWEIDGASDHLVSEAIYLRDPDGHGIEIYADRPRLSWRLLDGQRVYMATLPLNIDSLLSELGSEEEKEAVSGGWEMPAEAKIGHIHLHVSRLGRALKFYHDLVGFDIMLRYGDSALFMSAGGYHHHIGVNTWAGIDAPPPSPQHVSLESFAINLHTSEILLSLKRRLEEYGLKVSEGLFNDFKGYAWFTVEDLDGIRVEFLVSRPD
jgi:catechol 2,3-dioxygenase